MNASDGLLSLFEHVVYVLLKMKVGKAFRFSASSVSRATSFRGSKSLTTKDMNCNLQADEEV